MIEGTRLLARIEEILLLQHHKTLAQAAPFALHTAVGAALMEAVAGDWKACQDRRATGRRAYYLSAEYLVGRLVYHNLYLAGVLEPLRALLAERGVDLAALEDIEDDAFGNGGLGRLAACYLDSAAALDLPLMGYGLRYRYGLFKQSFEDGRQVEAPDDWSRLGDPWSIRRDELAVTVEFRDQVVTAVPYDMPVLGYRNGVVGTLRLWQTESPNPFDFALFNEQRYAEASADERRAADIVKSLYPNDDQRAGKILRIKQEYVLSSASMQDILRSYRAGHDDLDGFADASAAQLNDTHPVMAIPELIRLLTGEGYSFDEALETARRTFSYTNHTVMAEALEAWDLSLLRDAVPQIAVVIEQIDAHLRAESDALTIVRDGRAHMADLAVYATHCTNGVARIHSELLKTSLFRDWYAAYPERFTNVTNGIAQRRWLGLCNPALTALLNEKAGGDLMRDLTGVSALADCVDDATVDRFLAIKRDRKCALADFAQKDGISLPIEFMFDVQIKRLHEYKRQLLNAFSILAIYYQLKDGALPDFQPMLCLFAAKSAPGYARAKEIIHYIHEIAALVNADSQTNDRLRVAFLPNYNCSLAELIVPAADLSEQISTAGTEASGTGNMKLMLNGAPTLGTLDGANVEIVEAAGLANNYIFGATVEEIEALRPTYDPNALIASDALLRRVVETLKDGSFRDETGGMRELYDALTVGASWHKPDHYFLCQDFRPYLEAKLRANRDFADRRAFARKALANIAAAGGFSSDRAILAYAQRIWHIA